MTKIRDKKFHKETVELDDFEYFNCNFEKCSLVYQGGTIPLFDACNFDGCQFNVAGAAERTLNYLCKMQASGGGLADVCDGMLSKIAACRPPS